MMDNNVTIHDNNTSTGRFITFINVVFRQISGNKQTRRNKHKIFSHLII